jgi:hypothetical protein
MLPFPDFLLIDFFRLASRVQNRMPAPHPPKNPSFDALPPQPKIPHPLSSAATPSANTPIPTRRPTRLARPAFPDRACITCYTFASIKH